jgi:hypothetical protein
MSLIVSGAFGDALKVVQKVEKIFNVMTCGIDLL